MAEIPETGARIHPLDALSDEDREFVVRFVIASGSLKEVARQYGVSYPTIRNRLNRLIERLRLLTEGRPIDPMAELLSDSVDRGQLPPDLAQRILRLHRQRLNPRKDSPDHSHTSESPS